MLWKCTLARHWQKLAAAHALPFVAAVRVLEALRWLRGAEEEQGRARLDNGGALRQGRLVLGGGHSLRLALRLHCRSLLRRLFLLLLDLDLRLHGVHDDVQHLRGRGLGRGALGWPRER